MNPQTFFDEFDIIAEAPHKVLANNERIIL